MSPDQDATTVPPQPLAVTLLWGALVAAFSAAAWLIWLSWADDQPDLATWQIAGVVLTLLAGVTVGVWRTGPVSAWALTTAPFAAFGAYSIFGSDPLGPVGAAVWVGLVVMGVAALTGLVLAARLAVQWVRDGRNGVRPPS